MTPPFQPASRTQIDDTLAGSVVSLPKQAYYGTSFPPELYERLRVFVQTKGWNTLLDSVTFRSGERVVDLGFGDGGNTAQLARDLQEHGVACRVYGIDLSPDMTRKALTSYPPDKYTNLVFSEGAAEDSGNVLRALLSRENVEENARPIDLVLSNYTLHWVRNPKEPANFLHREMFRSLNPLQPLGGRQRHFCAHRDAFKELFEAGYKVIKEEPRWQGYFQGKAGDHVENGEWRHPPLITVEGITEALDSAGYVGTATLHEDVREFPSVSLLKAWVSTMIRPFMSRIIDGREKEDFVDAWIGRYLRETDQEEHGGARLWDRNLLVVAHKEREA